MRRRKRMRRRKWWRRRRRRRRFLHHFAFTSQPVPAHVSENQTDAVTFKKVLKHGKRLLRNEITHFVVVRMRREEDIRCVFDQACCFA